MQPWTVATTFGEVETLGSAVGQAGSGPFQTATLTITDRRMDPNPALHVALDAAYAAFAAYPRPQRLDASIGRDSAKVLATLSSAPLRELTGEQIGPYAGWALTTVGSVSDYKHFLPRILEQAVRMRLWMGVEPAVIAGKLKTADWRTWLASEQGAVLRVFQTAFQASVDLHPDVGESASDWLCGLAALGEDVRPLLQRWAAQADGNTLLQLADIAGGVKALASSDPRDQAYWANVEQNIRASIFSWLVSPTVRAALASRHNLADEDIWHLEKAENALAEYSDSIRH